MVHSTGVARTVLVVGATGNVGRPLVEQLTSYHHVHVVAAARTGEAFPSSVDVRPFDFTRPQSWKAALAGVDCLFLVRPPAISDVTRIIFPFLDQARDSGVRRIVLLSVIGADRNRLLPHRRLEDRIAEQGFDYVFLRPSFFMQNFTTTHREELRDERVIAVPAGRGRTSFIDTRDVAAVAATVLVDHAISRTGLSLTGSEALDYDEVAQIFTRELSTPVEYTNPSLITFYRRSRRLGRSVGMTFVMMGLYSTARFGLACRLTTTVQQLLGREPIGFAQFVRDYRHVWMPGIATAPTA